MAQVKGGTLLKESQAPANFGARPAGLTFRALFCGLAFGNRGSNVDVTTGWVERNRIVPRRRLCCDISIAQISFDTGGVTLPSRSKPTTAGLTQSDPVTSHQIAAI